MGRVKMQKPALWIGSSRDDLRAFPDEVRRVMGLAINDAQNGEEHPRAKALKGFGGRSVLEVVDNEDGDTYRAVYTVRFAGVVYVLHAFQKKSKKGIETPKRDIEVIKGKAQVGRSALPRELWKRSEDMSNDKKVTAGSGNVFADLGFANPEEELLKAKLIREIRSIIKRRKLTQAKAAILLGLKQPDVSSIITGRVGKFSLDRLVRCLDRLDYKVDVVVRHKPRRASRAIAA
jgi:phage-related protein/predicted XRE-type DNA-binding protein